MFVWRNITNTCAFTSLDYMFRLLLSLHYAWLHKPNASLLFSLLFSIFHSLPISRNRLGDSQQLIRYVHVECRLSAGRSRLVYRLLHQCNCTERSARGAFPGSAELKLLHNQITAWLGGWGEKNRVILVMFDMNPWHLDALLRVCVWVWVCVGLKMSGALNIAK